MATDWHRINFDDAIGTSFQGFISATSLQLEIVLGEPELTADSMQMVGYVLNWFVKFDDGIIASVYSDDRDPADRWRVGGHDTRALLMMAELLEAKVTRR
jgi:hypothetical protein